MKKIVDQAEKLAVLLSYQCMNRLVGVKETRPGHLRNFDRKLALVKAVIAFPQWLPLGKIRRAYGTNDQRIGHGDYSTDLNFTTVVALFCSRTGRYRSRSVPHVFPTANCLDVTSLLI